MKILHILSKGPDDLNQRIISLQMKGLEASACSIKVIDLRSDDLSYEELIRDIFACDKVVSW